MNNKVFALFGVVGPIVAYVSIGLSLAFSPWFSWKKDALSDLGHAVKSEAAPIYNLGLLLTGFLLIIYAVTALKDHARWTSYSLAVSAFILQLVATFDEIYGPLHFVASVLFFVSLGSTSIIYALEKKSFLAVAAFLIGIFSWVLYWARIYSAGIAVPETISSAAVLPWVISSVLKIYISKRHAR